MQVDFETKTETSSADLDGDFSSVIAGVRYQARLIFKHGGFRVTYLGESYHDSIEAALEAVQTFLDGKIYEREIWTDGKRFSDAPQIIFGPMSDEIRNIIEQAIDLKTGNDRNKLTGLMALPG